MKITTVLAALSLLLALPAFAEDGADDAQELAEAKITLDALEKTIGPATSDCKGCTIGAGDSCARFKEKGAAAADLAATVASNYVAAASDPERSANPEWAKVIERTEALDPKIRALAACSEKLELR